MTIRAFAPRHQNSTTVVVGPSVVLCFIGNTKLGFEPSSSSEVPPVLPCTCEVSDAWKEVCTLLTSTNLTPTTERLDHQRHQRFCARTYADSSVDVKPCPHCRGVGKVHVMVQGVGQGTSYGLEFWAHI